MGAETPIDRPIRIEELLEHASWLAALARRLVADSGLAEDLIQETWVAALKAPPRDRRNLRGWLGRVLTNEARQHHRTGVRRPLEVAPMEVPSAASADASDGQTPEELAVALESQQLLAAEVVALDEPYRQTLILRYWHGLDAAAIGRREGVAAGTVRWRLKQGMDRLRERLDTRHEGDRGAWCAALLPLARQDVSLAGASAGAVGASSLSLLLQGLLGMHLSAKLGFAAALAALAYFGFAQNGRSAAFEAHSVEVAAAPVLASIETGAELAADTSRREAAAVAAPDPTPAAPLVAAESEAPVASVSIELKLLDEAGRPVVSAALSADRQQLESQEQDPDGSLRAELRNPRAGRALDLTVAAPGHASQRLKAIVPAGDVLHLGVLVLAPGGSVSGRVLDERGDPVAGVAVEFDTTHLLGSDLERERTRRSIRGAEWGEPRTGADGTFMLAGVPARRMRIWASKQGFVAAASPELTVTSGSAIEGLELELKPQERANLIAGQVLGADGEPVPYARVELRYRHWLNNHFATTTCDDQGFFEKACDHPNADRKLRITDLAGRWTDTILDGVRPGGPPLAIVLGEPVPLAIEVAGPGGPIEAPSIRVLDLEGDQLAFRSPELLNGKSGGGGPLPDGVWRTVSPVVPFRITVEAGGFERKAFGPFDPVTEPVQLRFDLSAVPEVTGRATAAGVPLPAARVELLPATDRRVSKDGFALRVEIHGEDLATTAGADGRFRVTVRETGDYFVHVLADGYAMAELGPLRIRALEALDLGEIGLTQGGSLEGRVALRGGASPAGQVVGISRADGRARSARIGPDGGFRFDRLTPGPWQVELRAEEINPLGGASSSDSGRRRGPIEFNAEVREGGSAWIELGDAPGDTALLRGRLRVDGAGGGGFSARLLSRGELEVASEGGAQVELDDEGRFEVRARAGGRYDLTVSNTLSFGILSEVELVDPVTEWSLELELGTLEVEGLVQAGGMLGAMYLWEADGALVASMMLPTEDGAVLSVQVPAGRGRLAAIDGGVDADSIRDAPTLAEVEVPVGGTVRVRLD